MLNPMLPDEVAVKQVPRQHFYGVKELFAFRHFQGIVLARRLHYVAQVWNVVWSTLVLSTVFREGNPLAIIVAIIIYPIFVFYMACFLRLMSELTVSVLLLPSLLAKSQGNGGRGAVAEPVGVGDADLAAYGVSGVDGAGTIV
ncbi:unnamed protein product [Ectocarpus sp. CCAP 1310/34]|nr:unnamed protein product [Ectocarpus sp. CCAP 1310/34]